MGVVVSGGLGQARSQKFAMGGCFGGLGAEPLVVGSQRESGGEDPSLRRLREARGVGAEPPAFESFEFFGKNNFILGLF